MKRWDLLKALIRGVSFYPKKTLFFGFLALFALGIYFVWTEVKFVEAQIELPASEAGSAFLVQTEVEVTESGQVFINGKKNRSALRFLEDYDELRINVFKESGIFVTRFQAFVKVPSTQNVRQLIYATHGVGSQSSEIIDSRTLLFEASDISPQATLTIVAYLPKGMIKPRLWDRLTFKMEGFPVKVWLYVAVALPLLTILLMTFMILARRSATVFWPKMTSEPPGPDPPAVVGALADGTVGARELAATLIDLARRKYLFIINKGEEGFSFGQRKSGQAQMTDLQPFEKALLGKIFLERDFKSSLDDVEMRLGRHIFSRKIAQFYLGVYNQATRQGYFVKNPAKTHLIYKYLGIVLFFLSFLGFILGALIEADPKFGLIFWLGGMAAAFVIIKLSPFMPARTRAGAQALGKWLGFRRYLVSGRPLLAKDVLEGKFEEFLPYAMVLGCEVEWSRRFLKEPFAKPEWYESAERAVTLESFTGQFFPFIGYVTANLARSHEPTVE